MDLESYLGHYPCSTINRGDRHRRTALSWASARGDLATVKRLLDFGADPNILSTNGNSPLDYACFSGSYLVVDCLIERGANVNKRDVNHLTALHEVAFACTGEEARTCTKQLIVGGADVEARDIAQSTPLMSASACGNIEAVKVLLDEGADIETYTSGRATALFVAVLYSSHEVIRFLLLRGSNVLVFTGSGLSILHAVAERGDLETLQILTSASLKGLPIDRRDSRGLSAPDLAERRTEESPEWHAAFADLLASTDPEPVVQTGEVQRRAAVLAISNLATKFQTTITEEAKQIYQYLIRLPRPPSALLRVCALLCIAIAWLLLP